MNALLFFTASHGLFSGLRCSNSCRRENSATRRPATLSIQYQRPMKKNLVLALSGVLVVAAAAGTWWWSGAKTRGTAEGGATAGAGKPGRGGRGRRSGAGHPGRGEEAGRAGHRAGQRQRGLAQQRRPAAAGDEHGQQGAHQGRPVRQGRPAAVHARRPRRPGQRRQGAGRSCQGPGHARRRSSASSSAARICWRRTSSRKSAADTNQSLVEAQRAAVAADRAAMQAAQVGAGLRPRSRAPIAGRAGAINVYPGQLVQPSAVAGHDHPARPDRGQLPACRSATCRTCWRRARRARRSRRCVPGSARRR